MPLFMNYYLLAMLNNMALIIGSSEIDEEYELVLKEDVIAKLMKNMNLY